MALTNSATCSHKGCKKVAKGPGDITRTGKRRGNKIEIRTVATLKCPDQHVTEIDNLSWEVDRRQH